MPFTLAHPAAVLPLVRPPFVAAALVSGAMAPDAPYFVRATHLPVSAQSWYEPFANGTTSHTLGGLLPVDLPWALLLYAAWLAARQPLASLLPGLLPGLSTAPRRSGWPWVLGSLLLGVLTHLVWDSFTHGDGYVVEHVAFLRSSVAGGLTWARALQHVSTVVGLVAVATYLWRRRPSEALLPRRTLVVAAAFGAVGAVGATRSWWHATSGLSARTVVEGVLSDVATGAGVALAAALAAYVVGWWGSRRWRGTSRRRPPSLTP